MKKSTQLLIACFVLTVLSGVLRGRIDSRWGIEELTNAANSVESLPLSFGDWSTDEITSLDEEAANMLRCAGNAVGSYRNPAGELVSMIYLVGPAGPLAVHTPDVCYGSSNFRVFETTKPTAIVDANGNEHDFSVITFKENKAGDRPLRVYYAWNRNGEWVAPSVPRTAFAGVPMLYKMQVATHSVEKDENGLDAGERFLRDALPHLEITDW